MEEYFNSYWKGSLHDVRSAGKSVTSLLMGIAIDNGFVKSIDDKIIDYFPSYIANKKLNQITIKHLLTMSAGLDANAYDDESLGNETFLIESNDWVEFSLD